MANPRQIAFDRLAKLFIEVVRAGPYHDITKEQLETAGAELGKRFSAIMDEYDREQAARARARLPSSPTDL